jgi:hypothetical protein
MNNVPTLKKVHRRSFIEFKTRSIEQTTTFHACSVSKLMLILIDKTKTRIVQVKLQWKTKQKGKDSSTM